MAPNGRKPANGAFFLPLGMEDEFLHDCARPGALADAAAPPGGAEEKQGPPCSALLFGAVGRCFGACLGGLPPPAACARPRAPPAPPARARAPALHLAPTFGHLAPTFGHSAPECASFPSRAEPPRLQRAPRGPRDETPQVSAPPRAPSRRR